MAYVRGYATDNDGGQGIVREDAASVATVDGGTVLAAAGGVGRWLRETERWLRAEAFGAVGDGVTDDAAALQAALTAACATRGTVWLDPLKTYLTNSTLTIPAGVTLASRGGKLTRGNALAVVQLAGSSP